MRGRKAKFEIEVDKKGCFNVTSHHISDPKKAKVTVKSGKKMTIARYIYEECFGDIPEGMVIRHKCDNTNCINPEHMELGTQLDNIKDTVVRGRTTRGERNPACKITTEIAKEIRGLQGELSISKVAEKYNISVRQVWRIWTGENWKEAI